jgi:hypothetical protein
MLLRYILVPGLQDHMLENDERRLRRLARINIEGGLPPSVTLLSDLVKFLNEAKSSRGKRIVTILEQMLELEEMTKPIKPEEPMIVSVEWKRTDPEKYRVHWEIEKRRAILQRELSKYQFIPHAVVAEGGGGQGPSQWAVWWKGDSDSKWKEPLRMAPGEALELILKLTQLGDLSRLRRCSECQKWLFARFRHQTFCSTKCQQKNYTQSDGWKAHRRAYMRRYYQKNFKAKQR